VASGSVISIHCPFSVDVIPSSTCIVADKEATYMSLELSGRRVNNLELRAHYDRVGN